MHKQQQNMKAATYIVFVMLVISPKAIAKQWRIVRYLPLEDINITVGVTAKSKNETAPGCGRRCIDLVTCESFFHNSRTGECQYYDTVLTGHAFGTMQKGIKYYYIIRGRNDWCPFSHGFNQLAEEGPCVKFHSERKSWDDASNKCSSYSPFSSLVVADSLEKNEKLKIAGKEKDENSIGIWMGLLREGREEYKWVDGTMVNFSDWSSVYYYEENSSCVFWDKTKELTWSSGPCLTPMPYVCEVRRNVQEYNKMMEN